MESDLQSRNSWTTVTELFTVILYWSPYLCLHACDEQQLMTIVSTLVLYLICHGTGNVSLVFHTAFVCFFF